MSHVFISYLHDDIVIVEKLNSVLRSNGVHTWLDKNEIEPGTYWEDAIRKAIQSGAFFIGCFSKRLTSKPRTHMREELHLAIDELRKRSPDSRWFIPVLLSGDIPDWSIGCSRSLKSLQWIRLNKRNWDKSITSILGVIQPKLRNEQTKLNELARYLHSESARYRIFAAQEIRQFGIKAVHVIPDLVNCVNDENFTYKGGEKFIVKEECLHSIGEIAPNDLLAYTTLIDIFEHEGDMGIQQAAADAIGKMNMLEPRIVNSLVSFMTKHASQSVRVLAAVTLAKLSVNSGEKIPALRKVLEEDAMSDLKISEYFWREIITQGIPFKL